MYIGVEDKIPKYQLGDDLEVGNTFSANGFDFEVIEITENHYKVKVIDDPKFSDN